MKTKTHHFAEHVSPGHPDRLADAIAEGIVDHAMAIDSRALVGVEVAVHTNKVFIDGRVAYRPPGNQPPVPPLEQIVRDVYRHAGYGEPWNPSPESLVVMDDLCREVLSEDEAELRSCSDDQNVVIGYATPNRATQHLPAAHFVANRIGRALLEWRLSGDAKNSLGPDFKVLPHLIRTSDATGNETWRWERLTLSIQHIDRVYYEEQHRILQPVLESICQDLEQNHQLNGLSSTFKPNRLFLNGAGDFKQGGPEGDNGLSGKKLVVDHYGPDIPIGGGALCGKDPHKVDRVGPLRARQLARQLAATHNRNAFVRLAWSPGEPCPSFVEATLEQNGQQISLPPTQLPPRDWFSIETIFQDLNLAKVHWQKCNRIGYFASKHHPWG
ncbi:MAG: methionine adenosyltransferase domain-containing protein [Verrucomicrobia bacterium]|nr:methionine adenosyltransferase domain-containing protein [Verrucomicrobiota bacterium]